MGNSATSANGGAIYNAGASIISFTYSTVDFTSNSAAIGGAVFNNAAQMTFEYSTASFIGNSAVNGGAIYNLGQLIFDGSSVTFSQNTAGLGNDIYQTASATTTIRGGGSVYFGGGVEGSGLIEKSGDGNVYFQAGSKTKFDGEFKIAGGGVYFATSAVIGILDIGNATLGLDVDFYASSTSFISTTKTSIDEQSKLNVNVLGEAYKIVGGSTAVMFAQDNTGGIGFTTNNITAADSNGYRFGWSGEAGNYTGWIIYGALPWNTAVSLYSSGQDVILAQDISAVTGIDDKAFATVTGKTFTMAGYNGSTQTINSNKLQSKGLVLNNSSVTIRDLNFVNFVMAGTSNNGGAIRAINGSTLTFAGLIEFTGNSSANSTNAGGAIYNDNANINFVFSTASFTRNTISNAGGAIYNTGANSLISFASSTVVFTSNSAASNSGGSIGGGTIYNAGASRISFTFSNIYFGNNSGN
jgi:hypothetical protein